MKQSNTKKSLTLSAWALFISILMLIGTTFAWFTDSVTSGKNTIKAGNLDVELYHGKTLPIEQIDTNSVEDETDLFGVELWEPGVVAYENFTVVNVGNLALKYALNLNVFNKNNYNGKDLTEVIKVAVKEGGFTGDRAAAQALDGYTTLADFQETGNLAAKNNSDTDETTYGVVLYWEPTDHDNDYNVNNYEGDTIPTSDNQPLFVEFGINLVATQDTVEADSFDSQYDLLAKLPIVAEAEVKNNQDTIIQAKDNVGSILATATVPQAAELPEETKKIMMTIEEAGIPNEVKEELETGEEALNLDVKFFAVSSTGTKTQITDFGSQIVTVDLSAQIPEGHNLTKVFHTHNGTATQMQSVSSLEAVTDGKYYYDSQHKQLTIGSKTFSPFSFVIKEEKSFVAKVTLGDTTTVFYEEDYSDSHDTSEGGDGNAQSQALQAAFNHALLNRTSTVANVVVGKNLTLDKYVFWILGSNELNQAQTAYKAIDLATAPSAIIDLNGKIINFTNNESQQGFIFVNCNITFNDSKGGAVLTTAPANYVVFKYSNSNVTINSGTFRHAQGNALPFWESSGFATENKSNIKLQGGTYTRGTNMIGKEVTFETLESYNFYGYIPEGYHAVDNGDGTFSVVEGVKN